jgi:hypothetical protein
LKGFEMIELKANTEKKKPYIFEIDSKTIHTISPQTKDGSRARRILAMLLLVAVSDAT